MFSFLFRAINSLQISELFNKNVSTVFGAVISKMWSCLNFDLENDLMLLLQSICFYHLSEHSV